MSAHDVQHDYHLVDPSPWPALGSISAFLLALGSALYLHPDSFTGGGIMAVIGFIGVLYVMFGWWRDVIKESGTPGDHTPVVKLGLRYGVVLFISSEVMFFVAWFWGYFHGAFTLEQWPPAGIETFNPWHLPLLNTLILLLSGTTVTWAHHAIIEGHNDDAKKALWLTVVLGATFTFFQGVEYAEAPFAFDTNIYSGAFFMATGFHGAHVIIGTVFLAVCLWRTYQNHFKPESHFGFEAAAWYWHFVDVVWLFLFAVIYVWGR